MVRAVGGIRSERCGGIRSGESCRRDKEVKTSLSAPETLVLLFLPLCGRFLALKFLLLFKLMHGCSQVYHFIASPFPPPALYSERWGVFSHYEYNNYSIPYGAHTAKDRAVSGGDQ
jgi:hypothetical protein